MNPNPQPQPSTLVDVHNQYIRPKYRSVTEWRNDPQNCYIGRNGFDTVNGRTVVREASVWGNPFKEKDDPDLQSRLRRYEAHIRERIARHEVDLNELRGKRLGCWCVKDQEIAYDPRKPLSQYRCHGEVLLKILAENP